MQVASTIVARASEFWRNSASTGPNATRAGHRRTQPVPPAGDGDRRPFADRRRLESGLAKSGQAVVTGDAKVDRHHPFADQAVRQVAGHVGFALAGNEVAAGGLDGQAQRPAQLAQPLPLEAGQAGAGAS